MHTTHTTKEYVWITAALLGLLALTVGVAYVNLGAFNTTVAMLIAVAKGTLIVLFFMHVLRASSLIRLFVCAGFFWLALLIGLTLSDFLYR
jgi:cytochrome c oxidase subunit 4